MKHVILLVVLAGGCTRQSEIDFTKLDFSQLGDGGSPPGYDFSVEQGKIDMAAPVVVGVDLASTDLAGDTTGCGATANQTLSWYVQKNTSLQASGPFTLTVPDGVRLSGKVTLPAAPPGGTYLNGLIALSSTTLNAATSTTLVQQGVDGRSFTYSLIVPPGTYGITSRMTFEMANQVHLNRYALATQTVCEATVHDEALLAIPTLSSKTVSVSGLSAIQPSPSPEPRTVAIYMEDADQRLAIQGPATVPAVPADTATMTMPLPAEALLPSVYIYDSSRTSVPLRPGWQGFFPLPSQPSAASYALALPEVVQVGGSVTLGGGLVTNPEVGAIQCNDIAVPRLVTEDLMAFVLKDAPTYKGYYRKNGACLLAALYAVKTNSPGNTFYYLLQAPNGSAATTFDTDKTISFTMPSLPAAIAASGVLRDARGNALPNRKINAHSTALNGFGEDVEAVAEVVSDAGGSFRLNLPPGSYTLTVTAYLE